MEELVNSVTKLKTKTIKKVSNSFKLKEKEIKIHEPIKMK